MKRAFLTGQDIHLVTATAITGKLARDIGKEERKRAKPVNFGFLYGMYPAKFQKYALINYGLEFSMAECEVYRQKYFELFPQLLDWHERQKRTVHLHKKVTSPFGRTRHLPDVDSPDRSVQMEAERQAINSPVQSCASDITLYSMIQLQKLLKPHEAAMVMTLHDGIGFEIKEDRVDYYAPRIKEIMETLPLKRVFGLDLSVPVVADIEWGTHWKGTPDASGLGMDKLIEAD
jgi:DNA polymerase I-like protein with 3'-5' exonuclease and polymerase domains